MAGQTAVTECFSFQPISDYSLYSSFPSSQNQTNATKQATQDQHLSLMPPLLNLAIRLVDDFSRAARNSPPLDDMPSILVDFNAAIDIVHDAKRRHLLLLHVAEVAIRADEVRAPRSLRRAEFLSGLAGEVGHDQVVGHPGRARAFVDGIEVAFARSACEEGKIIVS